MVVVSDTSPLIYLAAIQQLHILEALYGRVLLPEVVYNEIVIKGAGQPGSTEVATFDWIEVKKCADVELVRQLQSEIDAGEAEAIVLAVEWQADWLLIDERRGRAKAKDFALKITGLLGILTKAKTEGLLPEILPLIDQLLQNTSFRISKELYEEVKRVAGE